MSEQKMKKPFLEQLLQEKARKLLQAAIEKEVIDYIQFHKDRRDENGQRLVVRNGHLPEREVISGVVPIPVRQPRVRHRDKRSKKTKQDNKMKKSSCLKL